MPRSDIDRLHLPVNEAAERQARAAPAVNWPAIHLPHGITAGELTLTLAVVAVVALLAVSRHARTIAKLSAKAAAPPPAPVKSGGGKGKLLVFALAAFGGIWAYANRHALAAVKSAGGATPTPSTSPSPRPTVTQTVAPHVAPAAHHLLSVSGNVVAMYAIAAVVAIAVIGQVARKVL